MFTIIWNNIKEFFTINPYHGTNLEFTIAYRRYLKLLERDLDASILIKKISPLIKKMSNNLTTVGESRLLREVIQYQSDVVNSEIEKYEKLNTGTEYGI